MKDYLEDICGDESCFFDKKKDLDFLDMFADLIKLGQERPREFDLIWTGSKCIAYYEDGGTWNWTEEYKHIKHYKAF